MAENIFLFLYKAGDHCAPVTQPYPPLLILRGSADGVRRGENGLFFSDGGVMVQEVIGEDWDSSDFAPFAYDFRYFSRLQRRDSAAAEASLQQVIDSQGQLSKTGSANALVPMIAAAADANGMQIYHYMQQGEAGALFLQYHCEPDPVRKDWTALMKIVNGGNARLRKAWPLFNDDCWYTKWLQEMEIERKFTFTGIPDTWRLINTLYQEVLAGKMTGFVPELDREFQVFDYESHIFEVLGEDAERGYISFIPQADGRMTLKRKWFTTNTEIRRETVTANHALALDDIDAHVATLTTAPYRRLPVFRRKRFDVNFESLSTGNIFGVYFDICRTLTPASGFSQCEVEYCRSRTLNELTNVMQEFEQVAAYVADFLIRSECDFRHDTFSKLDFVRNAADLVA